MFSLVTERGKYLRVRSGVTKEKIISVYSQPVDKVFAGAVIPLLPPKRYCFARVGDTYAKIAARERVDEAELKKLNGAAVIYPTLKIWLP